MSQSRPLTRLAEVKKYLQHVINVFCILGIYLLIDNG